MVWVVTAGADVCPHMLHSSSEMSNKKGVLGALKRNKKLGYSIGKVLLDIMGICQGSA